MLLHGEQDAKVPYSQSELLYEALKSACDDEAVFVSLPNGGHGQSEEFLTSDEVREGATIRSTAANDCKVINPMPFTPTWKTVIGFLDRHLRG